MLTSIAKIEALYRFYAILEIRDERTCDVKRNEPKKRSEETEER